MNKNTIFFRHRKAIAMIELIFAIVVMGIVMLSAPMLVNKATQSSYVALQQESIAAAAAQINMIMTGEWDESDTNETIGEPILRTTSPSAFLAPCATAAAQPIGATSPSGRYCKGKDGNFYSATAPSALGTEAGEGYSFLDDIDDYNNKEYNLTLYNSEAYATYKGDYIDKNITIISHIFYGDDTPNKADGTPSSGGYDKYTTFSNPFRTKVTDGSTNIKLITVELTSDNNADELSSKKIRLSAFMCNIGAPKGTTNSQLYSEVK